MTDIILVAVVALIVGMAIAHIVKAKKSGAACVGCPMSGECAKKKTAQAEIQTCSGSCSGCKGCHGCSNNA